MKLWKKLAVAVAGASMLAGCAVDQNGQATIDQQAAGAAAGAALVAAASGDKEGAKNTLLNALAGNKAETTDYAAYLSEQESKLRQLLQVSGANIQVQRVGDSLKLTMPGTSSFRTGSAELSNTLPNVLSALAVAFNQFDQNRIEVVGHTDSTGSQLNNQTLSANRAQSVANYLIAQGVDYSRVTATGLAATQPVASNQTAEGRTQNRRVEIILRK